MAARTKIKICDDSVQYLLLLCAASSLFFAAAKEENLPADIDT